MENNEEMKSYSLAELKDKYIGKPGTADRDAYEYELLMRKQEVPKQSVLLQKESTTTNASDFAGTLLQEGYQALNKHIEKARTEWDRDAN